MEAGEALRDEFGAGNDFASRPAFNGDVQPHVHNRPVPTALDVIGDRLQRRDVKRIQAGQPRLMYVDQ